ncbi:hypothetical protein [Sporomusa malonica]|uniref:Uncharacterized protein n=1 Tax=Sporomusa malonica TaxID=112901 RepID=A0A1W2CBV7_9FIRM|nr:hypothetical protein [Sporomusa malonica]SMC82660.1 hypothetical protein SAMN04488500_11080 [Sporomusa malonica]
MATKDLLDSNNAKNNKPAASMNNEKNANKASQKKHMPCKNSLPT